MAKLELINGLPTMTAEAGGASPYEESIYYSGGLTALVDITLPNAGSFTNSEAADLIVVLNKKVVEVTRDFNVVGAGPTFTQIEFVYDLPNDSVVVFKQGV